MTAVAHFYTRSDRNGDTLQVRQGFTKMKVKFCGIDAPEEEIHLNSTMITAGMAYHYAQYSGSCPNQDSLIKAEEIAKANRAGVWANPGAVLPWEWRKGKR